MRLPQPVLLVPVLAAGLLLTGCGGSDDAAEPADTAASEAPPAQDPLDTSGPENTAVTVGDCVYAPSARPAATDVGLPDADDLVTEGTIPATMATSAGDIPLELDAAGAPCTVASFTHLAREDYFDGTVCHRLTTQGIYVLQCGDPTGTGTGGPGYQFPNENTDGATYGRGTLAMANAGPGTNGSQFFLVYDDSPLPPDYSVFGTVTEEGLAVLDEIAAAGATGGAPDGTPATPVEVSDVALS